MNNSPIGSYSYSQALQDGQHGAKGQEAAAARAVLRHTG